MLRLLGAACPAIGGMAAVMKTSYRRLTTRSEAKVRTPSEAAHSVSATRPHLSKNDRFRLIVNQSRQDPPSGCHRPDTPPPTANEEPAEQQLGTGPLLTSTCNAAEAIDSSADGSGRSIRIPAFEANGLRLNPCRASDRCSPPEPKRHRPSTARPCDVPARWSSTP